MEVKGSGCHECQHNPLGLIQKGEDFYDNGDLDNSLLFFNKALENYISQYGQEKEEVAYTLKKIAKVYESQEKYSEAEEYLKRALDITTKCFGDRHIKTVKAYLTIVDLLFKQEKEKLQEAVNYLRILLRSIPANLEEELLDIAEYYESVGDLLLRFENFDNALEIYEKTLALYAKNYKEGNQAIAKTFFKLANVFLLKQDWENALKNVVSSISEYSKCLTDQEGKEDVCDLFLDIALNFHNNKCYDEAMAILNQLLEFFKGDNCSKVGEIFGMIGDVYIILKEYVKAARFHSKSLNIFVKFWGYKHHLVMRALGRLNLINFKLGMLGISKSLFQKMLIYGNKFYGADDPICTENKEAIALFEQNFCKLEDEKYRNQDF